MMVGPRRWMCVTTDMIGVPTGGLYGDIRRWEPVLNRYGLKLMWSRFHKCFMVYTDLNPARPVCKLILWNKKAQRPIPLTGQLVNLLAWLRDLYAREGGNVTFVDAMERLRKQRAQERYEEMNRDRDERIRFMEREVPRGIGLVARTVLSDLGPAYRAANRRGEGSGTRMGHAAGAGARGTGPH